jgi:hypothetical protein
MFEPCHVVGNYITLSTVLYVIFIIAGVPNKQTIMDLHYFSIVLSLKYYYYYYIYLVPIIFNFIF